MAEPHCFRSFYPTYVIISLSIPPSLLSSFPTKLIRIFLILSDLLEQTSRRWRRRFLLAHKILLPDFPDGDVYGSGCECRRRQFPVEATRPPRFETKIILCERKKHKKLRIFRCISQNALGKLWAKDVLVLLTIGVNLLRIKQIKIITIITIFLILLLHPHMLSAKSVNPWNYQTICGTAGDSRFDGGFGHFTNWSHNLSLRMVWK